MAINKFHRSRLAFDLSAKSLILESHQQTIGPIEPKFHVNTPFANLDKIYTPYFGHMTKTTAMAIYVKNPLKSSSPEPVGR